MYPLHVFDVSHPLIVAAVLVVPLWRIFGRAGFNPAWSLLVFLPWVGLLIVVLVLAFGDWPSAAPRAKAER